MSKIHINIFTDPTCPFAYSLEPTRWRLRWLYGDQITWQDTMIILSGYDNEVSPMTPKRISTSRQKLRQQHGMPMEADLLPRVPQSLLASKHYIAVRLHTPHLADAFLRHLRNASMNNALIDEQQVIDTVLTNTGLSLAEVSAWLQDAAVEQSLVADAEAARNPSKKAQHFSHKLSTTSTGRVRYPASSFVFTAKNDTFELPGFWPLAAYEAVIGNLIPDASRASDPTDAQTVLQWAKTPLATIEVATIINCDVEKARQELQQIAVFAPVGQDGFWSLK